MTQHWARLRAHIEVKIVVLLRFNGRIAQVKDGGGLGRIVVGIEEPKNNIIAKDEMR